MAGSDIGYYTLPVILSFQGIDQQVNDKLGKALDQNVPKELNKRLNSTLGKAIDDTSKKVGTKISTGVTAGINPTKTGKDIGTKIGTSVTDTVTKGDVGKKMGEAVSTTITKNFDPKALGKKIEQGLTQAQNIDLKGTGKKISDGLAGGIDIKRVNAALKDVLKEPLGEAKQVAKDWGKQVGGEILAGQVKTAAKDVDTVIKNTTSGINNLGKVVGLNLDSVEQFGTTAVTQIDNLAGTVQNVVDKVTGVRSGLKSLKGGDVVGGVRTLSDALRGVAPDSVLNNANTLLDTFAQTQQTIKDTADTATELKQALGFGAPVAGGALATMRAAAGPAALTAAGVYGTMRAGNWAANQIAPALGQEQHPWYWPIQQGFEMPGKWGGQIMTDVFGPQRPEQINPPVAPPTPQQFMQGAAPTILGASPRPQPVAPVQGATSPIQTFQQAYTAPPAPVVAAPSAGAANVQAQQANVSAGSASISVGSATVSGVSVPAPQLVPSLTNPTGLPGRGSKGSWYATGGAIPIMAHAGEWVIQKSAVDHYGPGFMDAVNTRSYDDGGAIKPPPPPRRRPYIPNRAAIKGVGYYDDGGEIKQLGEAIAGPVAKAAAAGAAQGAAQGAGGGMAKPAILGGPGGQQMGADIATQLLGIGAGGVGETLGLGTMFPDPMANPNVRSLMALASAFKGPIMGAMKGKLGIQQPGWKPGMAVNAMAGDQGPAASIGLPFGLPSIDLPNAPEGGGAPPGGGIGGGGDTTVDASLHVHGDVGSDKALRDHQQQIQRGLDRLAPMPTGPN